MKTFLFISLLSPLSLWASTDLILPSGEVFKLVSDAPKELSPAYVDPQGLVWSDVLKDESGSPREINYFDAKSTCEKLNARLPTAIELHRMRNAHSLHPVDFPVDSQWDYNDSYVGGHRNQSTGEDYVSLPNIQVDSTWSLGDYRLHAEFRRFDVWKLSGPEHGASEGGVVTSIMQGPEDPRSNFARCVYGKAPLLRPDMFDGVYPDSYVTARGVIFTKAQDVPEAMGVSYRDPSGLIWGNTDMRPDSNRVTYAEAESSCNSITWKGKTARLPSREEWLRVCNSMTVQCGDYFDFGTDLPDPKDYDEYKSPALPNLETWSYWSTTDRTLSDYVRTSEWKYVFDPTFGRMEGVHINDDLGAAYRCVLDP